MLFVGRVPLHQQTGWSVRNVLQEVTRLRIQQHVLFVMQACIPLLLVQYPVLPVTHVHVGRTLVS